MSVTWRMLNHCENGLNLILTICMRQVRFWEKPRKPKFRVWPYFGFSSVRFGFFKTEIRFPHIANLGVSINFQDRGRTAVFHSWWCYWWAIWATQDYMALGPSSHAPCTVNRHIHISVFSEAVFHVTLMWTGDWGDSCLNRCSLVRRSSSFVSEPDHAKLATYSLTPSVVSFADNRNTEEERAIELTLLKVSISERIFALADYIL